MFHLDINIYFTRIYEQIFYLIAWIYEHIFTCAYEHVFYLIVYFTCLNITIKNNPRTPGFLFFFFFK